MFRLGYFADGPWGHQALNIILSDNSLEIAFICGRYDSNDFLLEEMAKKNKIEFFKEKNINSGPFLEFLKKQKCDLFVSMSFNQIFKKPIINIAKNNIINCHAGKLPFYRGRNVLNWVLINDEKEFGITVHFVDEGIDTGDIILQKVYSINDDDDYSSLLKRAYNYCANDLYEAIKDIQKATFSRIKQSTISLHGSYCSIRKDGDEMINWKMNSREIFCFIRALCDPGPQAQTTIDGNKIKINKAEYIKDAPNYKGIPGAILFIGNNYFLVKTGDSYIKIIEYSDNYIPKLGTRFI